MCSDYAFGEQARFILQSLVLLFGSHIRSVNIMGKAGALVGKRGDILYPSHLIFEASTVGSHYEPLPFSILSDET
jgi:hypothetical protein